MVDYIIPKKDVLDLYRKQKSEFNFHQRSDDEFIIFLLDTASRVLSIAHQLTPVIEAVSHDIEAQVAEQQDPEDRESQVDPILKSETDPDPSSLQPQSELQPDNPAAVVVPCKTETMSCEEDAIFQLAKEIESVANTLLDKQCSNTMMSTDLDNSKNLPTESEKLAAEATNNQNINTPITIPSDQNFKPSVTALPYSMLDMSNITNDTSVNSANSDNMLKSISSIPGSKRSSLSSKPTERLKELKTMYDVSPFNGKAQCRICRREFTESANCRRHIETIHFNVRQFQCHLCDKNFHTNWVLQTHYKKKHNM